MPTGRGSRALPLRPRKPGSSSPHGTDTMTDTAKALAAITGKVMVLTGALAPARFATSDAAFNLGMAIATAQIASPGVYIAMSGQVFDGLKVRKDREAGKFVAKD